MRHRLAWSNYKFKYSRCALFLWAVTAWVAVFPGLLRAQTLYVVDGVVSSTNQIRKIDSSGVATSFASGFSLPRGLSRDASGNLFLCENGIGAGNGRVTKITPADVRTTEVGGFTGGFGVVFDSAGNLYVANDTATVSFAANTIVKFAGGAGVGTVFATGLNGPRGLAFDAAGNLFAANFGGGTVSKITPGGTVTTFATGLSGPWGLAFDTGGNLYVANRTGRTVSKITPDGTVSTVASTAPPRPQALVFDAAGVLYVGFNNGTISKIATNGTVTAFFAPPLDAPTPDFFSLAIDPGSAPPVNPIDTWRTAKFGTNASNPAIAGDLADPDLDGLPNLLEYALGSDPKSPSAAALPQGQLAGGAFTYTYRRNTAATDLAYVVESSTSLPTFVTATGFTTEDLGTVAGVQTIRLTFPTAAAAGQYLRVKVTRN